MLKSLVKSLREKIETCGNSDDLYGRDWDIADLAGQAMDRGIFLEDKRAGEEPVPLGKFGEILKEIQIAIDGCDDAEECNLAATELQDLARRIVDKMQELGPPE
jgi:hypothetical protein